MKRLLIVEDDPNTLSGLLELLSAEGYQVSGAVYGDEAKEVVAAEGIDIVLCDYCLPDTNGVQLCSDLKKCYPDLRLFLFSAFFNNKMIAATINHEIEKIFLKPINVDDLLETLFVYTTQLKIDGNYRIQLE